MSGMIKDSSRALEVSDGTPFVVSRGEGAFLFDEEGNRYLDLVQTQGSMILGHRHPLVLETLEKTFADGICFGVSTESENDLAQLLIEAVPSVEKVCLFHSRTDSVIHATHLAQKYTGRARIIQFEGNYHSPLDSFMWGMQGREQSLGIQEHPKQETVVLPYNDVEALRKVFGEVGSEIAAVIVEPVAGHMGCIAGSSNFLYELRHQTRNAGSVLIFDEVKSGFRVDFGGAQRRFSITPDLTLLGNVIGGGLPIGALGGKKEIMDAFPQTVPAFQRRLVRSHPLANAAGIATIQYLRDENPYTKLERKTAILAEGLEDEARSAGIPVAVEAWGSMLSVFFLGEEPKSPESTMPENETMISAGGSKVKTSIRTSSSGNCYANKIVNWKTASSCHLKRYAMFQKQMFKRGYYFPESQFEPFFISTAMTEQDVYETVRVIGDVFQSLE